MEDASERGGTESREGTEGLNERKGRGNEGTDFRGAKKIKTTGRSLGGLSFWHRPDKRRVWANKRSQGRLHFKEDQIMNSILYV